MELSLVESVLSLGIGGVGMIVIFLVYRLDRKANEKRLTKLLEEDQDSRKKNTEALTELTILVKRFNGKYWEAKKP